MMNLSLRLGIIGTGILLFLIVFGPMIAPHDMVHQGTFKQVVDAQGKISYLAAPYPPSKEYPLGTDMAGRDMLSILLHGARVTVLFAVAVAAFRILVGLPIAYAGAVFPIIGRLNEKISTAFVTVPTVLIVFLIVSVYNLSRGVMVFTVTENLMITTVVIALAGLYQTVGVLQSKMVSVLHYPFMEGLRSIGTGKWRILRKHVLPHMSAHIGIVFVTEIAQTLWLLAHLGVMYVFLGGALLTPDRDPLDPAPKMRIPEEWAGTIGRGFLRILYTPSLVIYPLLALTFAVLSFNMLADGIRKYHEQKWGLGRGH